MAIYGFIGAGNMGGALATALAKTVDGSKIYLSDSNSTRVASLCETLGASAIDNVTAASTADYLFLGVKPQMMGEMLKGIAPTLAARTSPIVLVSMAAGLTTKTIQDMASGDYPVIRIMPNMPCAIGEGMILYCTTEHVTDAQLATFLSDMQGAGVLTALPAALIDAGSAVSGCGPAFVHLFIEALADGGVRCGLPRDKALLLAAQTTLGAAKLVLEDGRHPGELKDAVCSPGGTTIEGVRVLEEGAFRAATMDAVIAAYEKTLSLKSK